MLLVSSCWPIDASPLPSRCPGFSPLSYKKQYTTHLHNIQLFPGKEPLKSNFERLFLVLVNYTIKCNTLGEQKEVHTEPW